MNTSNNGNSDKWEEVFNLCAEFLKNNEIVKDIIWKENDTGNKHPIQYPPLLKNASLFDHHIWSFKLIFWILSHLWHTIKNGESGI